MTSHLGPVRAGHGGPAGAGGQAGGRTAGRQAARPRPLVAGLLLAVAVGLAGCGEGGPLSGLRSAAARAQPDEFAILPTRPLELPSDLSALPPPAPGSLDRAAYRPRAEAIAALTGRPAAAEPEAPALVARAGPADPAIRATLAAEDEVFRRENRPRLLERLFRRDRSRLAYGGVILDADAEWERLRAAGVRVPAAPPVPD